MNNYYGAALIAESKAQAVWTEDSRMSAEALRAARAGVMAAAMAAVPMPVRAKFLRRLKP